MCSSIKCEMEEIKKNVAEAALYDLSEENGAFAAPHLYNPSKVWS